MPSLSLDHIYCLPIIHSKLETANPFLSLSLSLSLSPSLSPYLLPVAQDDNMFYLKKRKMKK
jgi:hypothetical protein